MRVFAGIVLLAVCVVIGFFYFRKYTVRKKEFEFLKTFNSRVKSEVAFSKSSLVSLVKKIDDERAVANYVREFFLRKNDRLEGLGVLKKEEKEFLSDYVKKLGQGDVSAQKDFLSEAGVVIDGYLSECVRQEKQYGSLSLKLGFLFGLIILIILL